MSILSFWKNNPSYWITINKEKVDKEIYDLFFNKYPENWLEQIIYLDQFSRHFQRHLVTQNITDVTDVTDITEITENDVYLNRIKSTEIVLQNLKDESLYKLDESELIFVLMPFKHIKKWSFLFENIYKWLNGNKIKNFLNLNKFFMDSYKKAYTLDTIKIQNFHSLYKYEKSICEFYSTDYLNQTEKLFVLDYIKDPIISLSGGVDSMVMLYHYKKMNLDPIAIHIIYNNRKESEDEYNFITEYCYNLKVPLYTYKIEWLKRDEVEREFYEEITRDIRFMVYKLVGGENSNVLLGHIKDDVIENIWTNFATCKHLDNLKKMDTIDKQKDVVIYRPMLNINKKDIFEFAHRQGIPYLKNTTPIWSNRGKYREQFYKETHKQYGESVDNSVIRFSEMLSSQTKLISKLLYEPIINSFDGNRIKITIGLETDIDVVHWCHIIEELLHTIYKIKKPSIHSIENFYKRIQNFKKKNENNIRIKLKKDITCIVYRENKDIFLEIKIE